MSLTTLRVGLKPILCLGIRRFSVSSGMEPLHYDSRLVFVLSVLGCLFVMNNSQRGVKYWKETEEKTDAIDIGKRVAYIHNVYTSYTFALRQQLPSRNN